MLHRGHAGGAKENLRLVMLFISKGYDFFILIFNILSFPREVLIFKPTKGERLPNRVFSLRVQIESIVVILQLI